MLKSYFNLPQKVVFCKKCVMSNQRPASVPEFRHTRNRDGAKYMKIDDKGTCDACRQNEIKNSINWEEKKNSLKYQTDIEKMMEVMTVWCLEAEARIVFINRIY